MSEQADLFPKDAAKANELKETDLRYRLKQRKKSARVIDTFHSLARTFREVSKKENDELRAARLKKMLEDNK